MSDRLPQQRYALGIEYDGTDYCGWQRLGPGQPSLQETVQQALANIAGRPIQVVCAGRTDAGVHAICQVVHFDCSVTRPIRAWTLGTNGHLPPALAVRWCQPIGPGFHARFGAIARRYRYTIANQPVRPVLGRAQLAWQQRPLNELAMQEAAQTLIGEQDFSAFRSAQCQARHARRHLQAITVQRRGDQVEIFVRANAFLHHMVRNLVGSLVLVGLGKRPISWMADILASRNRRLAGPTAPAQGLVFVGPIYPAQWGLPRQVIQ